MEVTQRENKAIRTCGSGPQEQAKRRILAISLAKYAQVYPTYGDAIDSNRAQVYLEYLSDLSLDDLAYGLTEAGKNATTFPTPGMIRRYATDRSKSDLEAEAHDALNRIDGLVERYGRDLVPFWGEPAPVLDAPSQRALQDIGGYKAYADRTERESPFMRRDFIAAYKRRAGDSSALTGEPAEMIALLSDGNPTMSV